MTTTKTRPVWTAPEGHAILTAEPKEHRVSSDHAWIDSGSGFAVTTWDGTREHYHYINTGWECEHPAMPAPSATPVCF